MENMNRKIGWKRQTAILLALAAACRLAAAPVDCGDKLQVMWDDHVVDVSRTTALRLLHHPVYAGTVMTWDRPWEGDGSKYPSLVVDTDKDGKRLYRMYYLGWNYARDVLDPPEMVEPKRLQTCYAESRDGINWVRPEIGLVEFEGSRKNNILLGYKTPNWRSSFFVFKDDNPKCPPEERYKGTSSGGRCLCMFVSADGIHFKYGWNIVKLAPRAVMDDTPLASFWYLKTGEYHVYLRGNHKLTPEERRGQMFADGEVRLVRHAAFKDLHSIEETRVIDCVTPDGEASEEYPMYTPCTFPYYRNPDIIVGFPTRYNQRGSWNANYDLLPDVEYRKRQFRREARLGLAVTDALFVMSRDGQKFIRYDEAFMRPGPQRPGSWVYGSCYPGAFVIPTPAADGSGDELSIYSPARQMSGTNAVCAKLERFTIRIDGFVSRHATFKEQKVVTKTFTFTGDEMIMNFSTSARGRIAAYLYLEGAGKPSLSTTWMFGDRVDSPATFPKGKLAAFAGKPVRLEFVMSDADLYSFRFR